MLTLTRRALMLADTVRTAGRRRIPNPELVTDDGRRVRFYDDLVRGRVVAVSFFYLRCTGICPRGTENLLSVQRLLGDRLGRDVFMYSVTLTPELDSPKDLRDYRARYHVQRGWTFLTGRPANVEQVPMPRVRTRRGWSSDGSRTGSTTCDRAACATARSSTRAAS
jgi:protein SCO1/2